MTVAVGLIGYGYWGEKLLRNLAARSNCKVVALGEHELDRQTAARTQHPDLTLFETGEQLIGFAGLDAVVIASPPSTHAPLASLALDRGLHVLVEKPLARTAEEVAALSAKAESAQRTLMVDHTFLYADPVHEVRDLLAADAIGEILYIEGTRAAFGKFQTDADVLLDLAPHDLSILEHVTGQPVVAIAATSLATVDIAGTQQLAAAALTAQLQGGAIANFRLSWMAPEKRRRWVIGGSAGALVYDDTDPTTPVRLLPWEAPLPGHQLPGHQLPGHQMQGRQVQSHQVPGRQLRDHRDAAAASEPANPCRRPSAGTTEPLARMVEHFLHCVETGAPALTGGASALRVARLIDAAHQSIEEGGVVVPVA